MKVFLRTADLTKKAEMDIDLQYKTEDVIQAAIDEWVLPTDTDYNLVNVTRNIVIRPGTDLLTNGVQEGDQLEIQPILVAGRHELF
jgi:hypothetical protein